MKELSVIIRCDETAQEIRRYVAGIREMFIEADIELVIVNCSGVERVTEEVMQTEQDAPDMVTVINCDPGQEDEELFEIGLEYAKGVCFLLVHAGDEFTPQLFDSLLYDEALIDKNTFRFLYTKFIYILQSYGKENFIYFKKNDKICLADIDADAGNIDGHYFFQDIYVANRVFKNGIEHIYDIGSRIDGYISHLLSMGIQVTMVDIRPLRYNIEGLDFKQGNATELSGFGDGTIQFLSCLHALEHFGLGRYGDPVDADGWRKALIQYNRVIKKGGYLYLSVPVGNMERVEFNAHRVFSPNTIVKAAGEGLRIEEFTFFHDGNRTTYDLSRAEVKETEEVLEYTQNSMMGPYDCGIFIFRKV